MLLGGQIKGGPLRLFMIYAAGNFIEATSDTPYLQIGEHKYGKPILDRSITEQTDLYDALKLGLISMDSTMRSNLGVGLPIDLVRHPPRRARGRDQLPHRRRRALFPRPPRALVGGAARRPPRHPAAALRRALNREVRCSPAAPKLPKTAFAGRCNSGRIWQWDGLWPWGGRAFAKSLR